MKAVILRSADCADGARMDVHPSTHLCTPALNRGNIGVQERYDLLEMPNLQRLGCKESNLGPHANQIRRELEGALAGRPTGQ